jgi:hypothetical protein
VTLEQTLVLAAIVIVAAVILVRSAIRSMDKDLEGY